MWEAGEGRLLRSGDAPRTITRPPPPAALRGLRGTPPAGPWWGGGVGGCGRVSEHLREGRVGGGHGQKLAFRTCPWGRGPGDSRRSVRLLPKSQPSNALSLKCLLRAGGGRCRGPGLAKMNLEERDTPRAPGRNPPPEPHADARVPPWVHRPVAPTVDVVTRASGARNRAGPHAPSCPVSGPAVCE